MIHFLREKNLPVRSIPGQKNYIVLGEDGEFM